MANTDPRITKAIRAQKEKENPRARTKHITEVRNTILKYERSLANIQSRKNQATSVEAKKRIAEMIAGYKQDIRDLKTVLRQRVKDTSVGSSRNPGKTAKYRNSLAKKASGPKKPPSTNRQDSAGSTAGKGYKPTNKAKNNTTVVKSRVNGGTAQKTKDQARKRKEQGVSPARKKPVPGKARAGAKTNVKARQAATTRRKRSGNIQKRIENKK